MQSALSFFVLLLACSWLSAATNPVPFVNEPLVPDSVNPGSQAFTLTVNGTGFAKGTVVRWNGSGRSTTFVSSSQLKAQIVASDVSQPKTAAITVFNPGPGGGTSNVAYFEVRIESQEVAFSTRGFDI
jgi:hypothetical protein